MGPSWDLPVSRLGTPGPCPLFSQPVQKHRDLCHSNKPQVCLSWGPFSGSLQGWPSAPPYPHPLVAGTRTRVPGYWVSSCSYLRRETAAPRFALNSLDLGTGWLGGPSEVALAAGAVSPGCTPEVYSLGS